jgi:pimeloyl-ACP methyl ester carboxylesterase
MYKSVELSINDKLIRGVVRTPDGNGPFPTVVFFHGFTVDHIGLMRLHELWARRCVNEGFAIVRFDFYGCGESDGDFSEMRFPDEIEQAKEIYRWTKIQSFCDSDKMFLSGHSLGGAIASVIAPELDPLGLILWAPGNTAYYDISGRTKAVPGEYKEYYDVGGMYLAGEFLEQIRKYDIPKLASGYRKGTLIVHGEEDEKVVIASLGPYLDAYGDTVETHIVRNANHQFSRVAWKNEVYDISINYIKQKIFVSSKTYVS